jgi:hypothetical protein
MRHWMIKLELVSLEEDAHSQEPTLPFEQRPRQRWDEVFAGDRDVPLIQGKMQQTRQTSGSQDPRSNEDREDQVAGHHCQTKVPTRPQKNSNIELASWTILGNQLTDWLSPGSRTPALTTDEWKQTFFHGMPGSWMFAKFR